MSKKIQSNSTSVTNNQRNFREYVPDSEDIETNDIESTKKEKNRLESINYRLFKEIKILNQKKIKKKENDIKSNEENPLNNYDEIELLMEKLLQGTENEEINSIKQEIEGINIDCRKINLEKFEKDDDLNGHVDFIYSCSNIRARNFNIKEIEKQKLKMIAGRFFPAMATTTAAITGIACLQIYISEIAI